MKLFYMVLGYLFLMIGCSNQPSPEAEYKKITQYSAQRNWGALYDSFDSYSKGQLDISLKMISSFATIFSDNEEKDEINNLSGKELFVQIIENQGSDEFVYWPNYEILKTEKKNGKAVLNVKNSNGNFQEVIMVMENGTWKLHLDIEGERREASVALAQSTLRTVSTAAETYAVANGGYYPTSIKDLTSANPPYLNQSYCDEELAGYKYKCNFSEDGYLIVASPNEKGNANEMQIVTGGVLTSDPNVQKITIEEKIKQKKQIKLAEESRAKKHEDLKILKDSVTVALIDKGYQKADGMRGVYSDYITMKLALANETDKDIRAIKGILIFNDVFGEHILSVNLKYDDGIQSNSSADWSGSIKYNQFKDPHQILANTELKNIIFDWKPEIIIFSDGSKIGK